MPDVIALGMPYFDLLLQIEKLPTFNQGARTLDSSWQYGGKVCSAAAAIARLGRTGGVVGPYGGVTGEYVKRDFVRHGLDVSHMVEVPGKESPMTLCLAEDSTGGRSFITVNPGKAVPMITAAQIDRDYITSGKYLLISGADEASETAARWCREAGIPVVIDADGYSDKVRALLPLFDHFIPSEFCYKAMFGEDTDYEKNLRILRAEMKNDRAVVVVTLGERGLAAVDENGEYFTLPAFKVKVADTTGAGDVFHGAYIVGRLEGMDAKETCRFSSAVSAIMCTRLGGRAGLPTMDVVKKFLATGEIDYTDIDKRVEFYRQMPFEM